MAISIGDSRPCIFVTPGLDIYDTCQMDTALLPGQDFVVKTPEEETYFRAATAVETPKCNAGAQDDIAVCQCNGDKCESVAHGYTQKWEEIKPEESDEEEHDDDEPVAGIQLTFHGDEKCGDGFKNFTFRYTCDYDALEDMIDDEDVPIEVTFTSMTMKGCNTVVEATSAAACPVKGRRWMRILWVHVLMSFLFWACCFGFLFNLCCLLPVCLCCRGRSRRARIKVVNIHPNPPTTVSAPIPLYTTPHVKAPVAQPIWSRDGYMPVAGSEPLVPTGKM